MVASSATTSSWSAYVRSPARKSAMKSSSGSVTSPPGLDGRCGRDRANRGGRGRFAPAPPCTFYGQPQKRRKRAWSGMAREVVVVVDHRVVDAVVAAVVRVLLHGGISFRLSGCGSVWLREADQAQRWPFEGWGCRRCSHSGSTPSPIVCRHERSDRRSCGRLGAPFDRAGPWGGSVWRAARYPELPRPSVSRSSLLPFF